MIGRRQHGIPGQVDKFAAHIDVHCQAHQACLVTRPVCESLGDTCAIVTRLSHVLTSARAARDFNDVLDRHVENIFSYQEVFQLPANAAEWRAASSVALAYSKAAGDMSEEDCAYLQNHDNSDWSEPKWVHYHLVGGRCPIGCLDKDDSLLKAKAIARTAYSRGPAEALLYRFKNVDKAWSYAMRGRSQHDILYWALAQLFTQKELDEGEQLVEAANAIEGNEAPFWAKTAAKAKSILRSFLLDPGGKTLKKGIVITRPTHSYLNFVMRSDKLSEAYHSAIALDPSSDVARKCKGAVCRVNAEIVSGRAGMLVVVKFTTMLMDLDHHNWAGLDGEAKLQCGVLMTKSLCAAFRRLYEYFKDPRFQVFNCCGPWRDDGTSEASESSVLETATILHMVRGDGCALCLDPAFAAEMCRYMETWPKKAVVVVEEILAALLANSSIVERTHLYGQELKPPRSRGVAKDFICFWN